MKISNIGRKTAPAVKAVTPSSRMSSRLPWYQSLCFRLLMAFALVYIAFCLIFSYFLFNLWEEYWVEQRMTEVSRYCNYIAGEVAFNAMENEGEETTLASTSLQSVVRRYTYMRILLINKNGRVIQDTSQSRIGRYIINDEVLTALSGSIAQGGDDKVQRIAVPITIGSPENVQGVVYTFASMESLQQSISAGKEQIVIMETLLGVVTLILFYIILYAGTHPFNSLLKWLRQFRSSRRDEYRPNFKVKTEYSEMVEAVEDSTSDLIAMDKSRGEFVSNVSHELKTPLSSIKVLTESLLLQQSVPEEVYKEFLQDINSEVDRMTNIVNDLLTLVRLEEGKTGLNLSTFDLGEMVRDILKRLKPLADQKKVTLELEEEVKLSIEADSNKLTLAISNLVQNGIKYNREDGKVTVRLSQSDTDAVITVSDTGIGIAPEHFDKLFQRFYRVDNARGRGSGTTGGTGLGLSIVRQIVNMHHGTITVNSEVDKGSSFIVKIPMDQTLSETEEEEEV